MGRGAWGERIVASESEGSELAVIKSAKTKPNCSGVRYWHIGTYDERRRDRPGKQSQFPARGAGLWRPSPTQRVVPRKQLKVYFSLPHARPVPVKVGLELNRSAVGKTANSLVYLRPQQLTPLPCGGPARLDPSLGTKAIRRAHFRLGHAWRQARTVSGCLNSAFLGLF